MKASLANKQRRAIIAHFETLHGALDNFSDSHALHPETREILDDLNRLEQRFDRFCEHADEVGRRLASPDGEG